MNNFPLLTLNQPLKGKSVSKKSLQSVIIANDLATGRSVYLTPALSWTEDFDNAQVLQPDQIDQRLAELAGTAAQDLVIDPYAIDLNADHSAAAIREQIRVSGPTILIPENSRATAAA